MGGRQYLKGLMYLVLLMSSHDIIVLRLKKKTYFFLWQRQSKVRFQVFFFCGKTNTDLSYFITDSIFWYDVKIKEGIQSPN